MAEYTVGAQLWTVRDHIGTMEDIRTTFKKISDIGYKAIEAFFQKPLPVDEILKVVEDNGLVLAGLFVDWNRLLNETGAAVEEYRKWGCKNLVLGAVPAEYYSAEGLQKLLGELPKVGAALRDAGLDLVYHNHSHEFFHVNGRTWLEALYAEASPADLKAELDVYWIQHGGGDPAQWIREHSGRIAILHLKDMIMNVKREQLFAEVGEGNLNWPSILEAAKDSGAAWYVVEQDLTYERDPFDALEISYRNLQKMGVV